MLILLRQIIHMANMEFNTMLAMELNDESSMIVDQGVLNLESPCAEDRQQYAYLAHVKST